MASRIFSSRLATAALPAFKGVAPSARTQLAPMASKRAFTGMTARPSALTGAFKQQQQQAAKTPLSAQRAVLAQAVRQTVARRSYNSEMASALVEVSQNLGIGAAAAGLTGPGIGIGVVFAALISGVARNPALRGQLFTYAIFGFALVEAIALFSLMLALMAKFV